MPTNKINVKAMCACGEEVTERLNALDDTMILLAEVIETGACKEFRIKSLNSFNMRKTQLKKRLRKSWGAFGDSYVPQVSPL
jgi:hypothetical protein